MSENQATGNSNGGDEKAVVAGNVAKKHKRPMKSPVRRKKSAAKKKKAESSNTFSAMTVFTGVIALTAIATIAILLVPQRADVRLDGAKMDDFFMPNKQAQFILGFHNFGQTNAHVTEICGRFVNQVPGEWPSDPDTQFEPQTCFTLPAVIEGGKTHYMAVRINGPKGDALMMPDWMIEGIKVGKIPAINLGRVTFTDPYSWLLNPFGIFGPQRLYFCTQYEAASGLWRTCPMAGYTN